MFYIVSKDQVNGEFSVQIVDNEDEVSDVVGVNKKKHIDSVAMSKDDLMLLTSVANNIN